MGKLFATSLFAVVSLVPGTASGRTGCTGELAAMAEEIPFLRWRHEAPRGLVGALVGSVLRRPAREDVPSLPVEPLTAQDRAILRRYTGRDHLAARDHSRAFNAPLWALATNPASLATYLASPQAIEAARLVHALRKLPVYRGVVYRGVNITDVSRYAEGAVVTEPAFVSTSLDRNNPYVAPSLTVFVIRSRLGRDVAPHSEVPAEREVMFMPFTRFRVVRKRVRLTEYGARNAETGEHEIRYREQNIVELEEV